MNYELVEKTMIGRRKLAIHRNTDTGTHMGKLSTLRYGIVFFEARTHAATKALALDLIEKDKKAYANEW
jgi:hypothetical protein